MLEPTLASTPSPWALAADILDPPSVAPSPWIDRPAKWVTSRLGETTWSKQREVMRSVRDNRRTAVHSCHSTGKSWSAARIAAWWIDGHAPGDAFVVTTAPTGRQVRAILWREMGRAFAKGKLPGRMNQTEWWLRVPSGVEEMVAFGQKPSDLDPSAFQGIHQRYVLVILDEACGVGSGIWEAADTLLANDDSRIIAIGNPDDPNTEFGNVCKPGSGWHTIHISYEMTPNFTGEAVPEAVAAQLIGKTWVEEKRVKWGEDSALYTSKVLGQFPEVSLDGLIPLAAIRGAQDRALPSTEPNYLGVDVGRGGDKSTVAHRRGSRVRIIRRDQVRDTMQTTGNVVAAMNETGATSIRVDEIGVGAGVADRLKEQNLPVEAINVGRRALDSQRFLNIRAEGYWGLRERFISGDMDIDPNDDDLAAQLADIRVKRSSSGRLQVESKEEMRRRGRSSPDEADAVMMAYLPEAPVVRRTWGRR